MANLTKPPTKAKKRSYLTPRPNRKDNFKVYKPVSTNPQIEAAVNRNGERTIHIDLEVVYNLAMVGMNREMVAGFYGMNKRKFAELCEEFPEVNDYFLQGASFGVAKVAKRFHNIIETGSDAVASIAAMFRLKTAGLVEKKDTGREMDDDAPRVNVYLPENNR